MKIKEVVSAINNTNSFKATQEDEQHIYIYDLGSASMVIDIPYSARNWADIWVDWGGLETARLADVDVLTNTIHSLLQTKVENRGIGIKKYVLPIGTDGDGDTMYLIPDGDGVEIHTKARLMQYTKAELEHYKEKYPKLANLIDEVKTEVPYED